MMPPQENRRTDEMFAKRVAETLSKQPEVSNRVANRLALAREMALKQMKVSKEEDSFFDKMLNKIKEVFSVQMLAGVTATATVCFAVLGYVVMDQENQLVFDDNITAVSSHFEKADTINNEIEESLVDDEKDVSI